MKDINTIHFQSREFKVMFRHRQIGGRTEYTMEDYEGNVILTKINPAMNFEIWVHREAGKLFKEGSSELKGVG